MPSLMKPYKTLLKLIKLPYKKLIVIRAFHFQGLNKKREKKRWRWRIRKRSYQRRKLKFLLSVFGRRRPEEMDEVVELMSMTELRDRGPCSSPITPALLRMMKAEGGRNNEVEEACRSFENYLVEMIVEEGKVRDLMDVEELLSCWNSLKSPVFVDLVSRFYGELCKDLFSDRGSGDKSLDLLQDHA
ncbi:uncharacterized protein LOC120265648 [Dioscorea cayenensis subsp. rotundata]|uniref:Uncharacterized protein LOC120265648 n=1 Tax=Dioscorea cayennensis subsp. rotundata TaxID=55577 RepID=A0AB40BQ05_DIOCR|nr:uncharacterized protein LOC120265648 [Dioscorea cayenensis subsp. rotundata]